VPRSIVMSIRAFPISRLEVIPPLAIAKEEQTKKNSTTEVVRKKKRAKGVRSIE